MNFRAKTTQESAPESRSQSMLDPKFLLMLLTVSEMGSINKAAKALNISQPALSKNLKDFEARIGADILDRSQSGTNLTKIGEVLCQNARSISAEMERAQRQFESMRLGNAGTLTIGSSPIGEPNIIPRAIEIFMKERSNFRLIIADDGASELTAALARGDIDMNLGALWDNEANPELIQEVLFQDRMVAVARSGHPLAAKKELRHDQALDYGWIMPPADLRLRLLIENTFRQLNCSLPPKIIECTPYATVRNLVHAGDWLATLPLQSVANDIRAGTLAVLNLDLKVPRRPIGIITHASSAPSSDLLNFIECLKAAVAELELAL